MVDEVNIIKVQPGVDHSVLRALDKKVAGSKSFYRLVICRDEFGMRGIDYRSPSVKLTLVLAKAFKHSRDMKQGLSRVGRFTDDGEVISFIGEKELINDGELSSHEARLAQFIREQANKKYNVAAKAVFKKTAIAPKPPVLSQPPNQQSVADIAYFKQSAYKGEMTQRIGALLGLQANS
jgi:hypothetical protein